MNAENTARRTPLIARHDTLLGVCEGLGEDLGISGNWFRLAFALALFWSPVMAIGAYLALGLLVLATRLLYPEPRAAAEIVTLKAEAPAEVDNEALPLAA